MYCGVTRVLAAAVLAAIAFAGLPATLLAQTPGPADTDLVDPPDTVYSTGGQATDPQVERGLPIIEHHRAFLPEQVDLSSRMPAVGDQGRLGSCYGLGDRLRGAKLLHRSTRTSGYQAADQPAEP